MATQTNTQINNNVVLEEKPKKLSKNEKKKLRVITELIEGQINGTQAAEKLGITTITLLP